MAAGIKTSGQSSQSLIKALSDQMGYTPEKERELSKVDKTTGSLLCATIETASDEVLEDAAKHFEAESVMYKARAQATLVEGSSKNMTKKSTYAWFASQAIKYYLTHKGRP